MNMEGPKMMLWKRYFFLKHGHFFLVSMLDFWGVDPENRPSLK